MKLDYMIGASVDRPFDAYKQPGDSIVTKFLGKSNMFGGTAKDTSDKPGGT